jgi:hypothetical protein
MNSSNLQFPNGSYMRKQDVLDYVYHRICKSTLGMIIEKYLVTYTTFDGCDYINVQELQNIMMDSIYKRMECCLTTTSIYNSN